MIIKHGAFEPDLLGELPCQFFTGRGKVKTILYEKRKKS
jgi:hypothetical protein